MPKRKADNVTEAAQETPLEGAEQASHIEQIPTDASEGAESAETEILQHNVDNVTEDVQDASTELLQMCRIQPRRRATRFLTGESNAP